MSKKINILFAIIAAVCIFLAIGCGQAEDENQAPTTLRITNIAGGDYIDDSGKLTTNCTENTGGLLTAYVIGDQTTVGYNYDTLGRVTFQLMLNAESADFEGNWGSVILDTYRVSYRRTDGRATPGLDVPYPFDGACNVYIQSPEAGGDPEEVILNWVLFVRGTAKDEPPLSWLHNQDDGEDTFISEIILDFWGKDLMGNSVHVCGKNLIEFRSIGEAEVNPTPTPATILLSADPSVIDSDQTSTITATVLDQDMLPLENIIVTFSIENGVLNTTQGITGGSGDVSVTATPTITEGTMTIEADAGFGVGGEITVTVEPS